MKKYRLTEETKEVKINNNSVILHRIQALKNFIYKKSGFPQIVKSGDLGGFIENEENLSQSGNAWVTNDSMVCGNAHIMDNAVVHICSTVYGNAVLSGNAVVGSWSKVCGNAVIKDNAEVRSSKIYGSAVVSGKANIYDRSDILGNVKISDNAIIYSSRVTGNAIIKDNSSILCDCEIFGNAIVSGNTEVCCGAYICGNAHLTQSKDWLHVVGIGGFDTGVTFFRNKYNLISVSTATSIFEGGRSSIDTIDDFLRFIKNSSEDRESENYHIYKAAAELARLQIGLT